ncbi:V-type proton ATPase 116 kDa subunit a 4-like [Lycorma delicatula]|uniref:V-type proton ATPase 116 kDa subunit a 4-like n=1 Tax=Lycorma delicatula TaxID=130591 RepID=UPI003F51412E
MGLFRCEEMLLYQIFLQYDVAYETTVNLGEAGIIELMDGPTRSNTSNESLSRILESHSGRNVRIIAGVILQEKLITFERVIWRLCQGNVFFNHLIISHKTEDPDTGNEVLKAVFYAVYQGNNLEYKLLKLCEGFKATVYNCPESQNERIAIKKEIALALADLKKIVAEASRQRRSCLELAAKNVLRWEKMIRKAKATFFTMNKFQPDISHKVFIAQFWIPACRMNDLQQVLSKNQVYQRDMLMKPILVKIDTDEIPPTYHDLNKFTQIFQDLLDAYGANTYQEHNPAPYYIVTFPFLFSIMFGDAGHGAIMTIFAIFLIMTEEKYLKKKINGEIMNILYSGRYMILLMGLFSIQSGILYNDIFSLSSNIFHSSWEVKANDKLYKSLAYVNKSFLRLDPEVNYESPPYPIGLDPIWAKEKSLLNDAHSSHPETKYRDYPKAYGDYYDFCERFGRDEEFKSPKLSRIPQRTKYRKSDFESLNTTRGGSICKKSISGGPKQIQCGREDESGIFDIFTHQAIHTIEFLLGTVSNTASYLRLWALSLAHEQLSEVVWNQVLNTGLGCLTSYPFIQPIILYFIFIAWAALSVTILVLMEGLSAFLHTLRLHWIEFQSKFYDGNGRVFTPFYFPEILSRATKLIGTSNNLTPPKNKKS